MSSRLLREGALVASLVVSLLCALARPAFADGPFPSEDAIIKGLVFLGLIIAGVIALIVVLIRAIIRTDRKDAAALNQAAAETPSPLPAARVVRDRDEPS